MTMIHVRVARPVMGLTPGTTVEVDDADERVRKMLEFGHLWRAEPDQEPEPPAEPQGV